MKFPKRTRYILVGALVVILIIVFTTYHFLGGFKSASTTLITAEEHFVVGKYFEGSIKSKKFTNLFEDAAALLEAKKVNGKLCGIYYNDPKDSEGDIKAVIGIMVMDTNTTIPTGYEYFYTEVTEVVQSSIEAHILVGISKAYAAAFNTIEKEGLASVPPYFEWFENQSHVFVEIPIVRDE